MKPASIRFLSSTSRRNLPLSFYSRSRLPTSFPPSLSRDRAFNSSLAIEQSHNYPDSSLLHVDGVKSTKQYPAQSDSTLTQRYYKLVESGTLRGDDHQTRTVHKLQALQDRLKDYDPPKIPDPSTSNSLLSRLFSLDTPPSSLTAEQVPRGMYIHGDVGTGKTMLMDLFYQTLPSSITRKRRVHFHAFMVDVHKRVHAAKMAMGYKGGDPILPIARDLANDAFVLCFDEFQVTDIADAMILRRLFESLLNFGVVCVFTSNRCPDDLYKGGLQRSSFIPAIELLNSRFEVVDLDSGTDYRRIPRALSNVYLHPLTPENNREMDKIFRSLTGMDPDDPVIRNRSIETWGRIVLVPQSTTKIARFKFEDLCGKPLSAGDYIELTKTFGTIFLIGVPKMGLHMKDLARRFITFIDACYESKTKLFITSEVPIFEVFSGDDNSNGPHSMSDHMRSVMDDLGLSDKVVGSSSIFTGEEELFAFARACSRLVQMGSKEWAESSGDS